MTSDIPSNGEIISAVSVSKNYGATRALNEVSVAINPGEVHALVGENGAGKSTLAKILAGAVEPSSGHLQVAGVPVRFVRPRDALRAGIAIVQQELALLPSQSVIRNVFLGLEDHRAGILVESSLRGRYAELVRRWGFDLHPDMKVSSLSIGDQQKVEILRALARDAKLIIMDEPTARLTTPEAGQFHKMVRELRDQGKAIVLVSHFLEEVLRLSDRVTIMRDGCVVRSSKAEDETSATLVQGMLGRSIESTFPPRPRASLFAEPRLEVIGLSGKKFSDVSFSVRSGEILGIAGMIGSGRSELLRTIFGADRAIGGEIRFGTNVHSGFKSPREAIAQGLALLPESRKDEGLLLSQTVGDNIVLPHLRDHVASAGVLSRHRQQDLVNNSIGTFGIRCAGGGASMSSLSGGNQQKVVLAKCLLADPKVLLLDEPTRGVDIGAKRSIYELLFDFVAKGGAIVVVSSELEEVIGLSDDVVVMRRGQIAGRFSKDEATEERILAAAFGTA